MSRRTFFLAVFLAGELFVSANDTIRFTWKGGINKQFSAGTAVGKQFTVKWGDNTPDMVIVQTATYSPIFHSYSDTIYYEVNIIGNGQDSLLGLSNCSNSQVISLDVSKNKNTISLNCSYNQISSLDFSKNTALSWLWCNFNLLTSLDLTNNTSLQYLYCNNNELTTLDLTTNKALQYLECHNNNLSSLIIPSGVTLQRLYCQNNQLLLSDLYALQPRVQFQMNHLNKRLGQQFLPTRQVVAGDTIDFSSQTKFNTTNTVFNITKDGQVGTPAVINVDYTIDSGKIVFLVADTYMLNMYNSAITSDPAHPAMVNVEFIVRAKNTDASLFSLTVSEGVLKPDFHSDTLHYFVEVKYEIKEIFITALQNDSLAIIIGDTGTHQLDTGYNVFIINVIAEDQTITQNYVITVNRADTIIDTTNIVELRVMGNELRVYPNPTTGKIIIRHSALDAESPANNTGIAGQARNDGVDIEIYDVVGCKLWAVSLSNCHDSHFTIDISHLPNGLYFLKVGGKVFKVVKE